MGKLSSILLGTASGVAVALFLTSEKGKQVTSQAQDFIEDLKEDPEYAKEQALEKLTEVKKMVKKLSSIFKKISIESLFPIFLKGREW